MPYKVSKSGGRYKVTSPHGTKAKGTTKAKAKRQANLLRAGKHGGKPSR